MSSIIDFGTTPQLPVILTRQPVWYKAFGATVFSVIVLIADGMFVSLDRIALGISPTVIQDVAMLDRLESSLDGHSVAFPRDYCRYWSVLTKS